MEKGLAIIINEKIDKKQFIDKLHNFKSIKSFDVSENKISSNEALIEIGKSWKHLESLDVVNSFFDISRETVHNTLKILKNLKRLRLGLHL